MASPDLNIVRENIESMIQQGASEDEIDAYIGSEGVTLDQLRAPIASASAGQGAPWSSAQEAMDMLTMGGQSKLNAAGIGLIDATAGALQGKGWDFSTPYNRELDEQRAAQAQYGEEHPIGKRVGQGAGLAVGIARLPAIAAFRGPGMVARSGNASLTGGTYGAAGGALQDANSWEERLRNTGVGAGFGAVFGLAAPTVAKGIGAAWGGVANWLSNRGIQSPAAVRKILERLQATGMTPQQAQQRLNELGPEGMLADVNPGMQAATGATSARDPGAAAIVSQRLGNRMEGAQQRISNDLDATIGPARDPYAQIQSNRAQRGNIAPQYEDSLTNAPPLPQGLRDILAAQLTNPASSLSKRNFMFRIMDEVDDALSADTPELVARRLHDIRKNLDAQIVRDPRAFANLSSADRANQGAVREARDAIDDVLKNRIPGFQEADEAFAPIARQQEAYEAGRNALGDRVSVGEHRANVAGYSAAERQMSNSGMRYNIEQQLDRPRRNPGLTADRLLGSNAAQQKLEASIGQPGAERLRRGIGREETFTETSNLADVRRNSRTAPLLQVGDEMWGSGRGVLGDVTASAVGGYAGGGLLGSVGAAVGTVGRRLGTGAASALSAGVQRTIRETADRLTSTGTARATLMRQLQQMAATLPRNQRTARNIEVLATRALVRSGGLLAPAAGLALGLSGQSTRQ